MPSSGPNNGGTFANDNTISGVSWAAATSAQTSDGNFASSNIGDGGVQTSQYLKVTNFGFAIPAGAIVDGIVVEVERQAQTDDASPVDFLTDRFFKLVVGGTIQGQSKGDGVTHWPTMDSYKTYGSSTDKWGNTITAANVNASDFGVVVSALRNQGGGA